MTMETLNFEQEKLLHLSELLVDRVEEVFDKFGVNTTKCGDMFVGCCPIHGGDNKSAFNLYPEGHTIRGNWVCRTHHCNKIFKGSIIGFIRGMLSAQNGWSEGDDSKKYPWIKTIMWCCGFLGIAWKDVKINENYAESKKFIASLNTINRKRLNSTGIERSKILKSLEIPGKFFLERGYPAELLSRYDIGLCKESKNGFLGRVIAPVYDDSGKFMVAYTGRTINPKCPKCGAYHQSSLSCPTSEIRHLYSKWKNSSGINSFLYNFWAAKRYIKESGKVILVEGPADVWRLEQFGIKNSVAIFGCDITDEQSLILECSGCLDVVLLLDMDDAGRKGCETIKQKLQNSYNLHIPTYDCHDPAELTLKEIQRLRL